jgi:hypothetical protein
MAIVIVIIACALAFTSCDNAADLPELDLPGEIRLSNPSPKVGETITAVYNRCNGTGEQTWRWFRADDPIEGAANATYTAVTADVGKAIKVQLSFAHQTGSLIAVTAREVAAATGNVPNPGDGETDPTGNGSDPGDGETDPTDNGSNPGDGETDPTGNGSDPGDGKTNPTDNGEIDVVPVDPVLSRFLGWQWEKPSDGFVWVFNNNGTIFGIHHCGEGWDNFSYLIHGNVLITYGSEMEDDELIVTTFIMAENGASFTRINGSKQTIFNRKEAVTGLSAKPPLVLSNALVGTWQQTDGTEYTFSSDAGFLISSSAGSEHYRYLVRGNKLVTLVPFDDETTAAVTKEYQFKRMGNDLELTPSGGSKITLRKK